MDSSNPKPRGPLGIPKLPATYARVVLPLFLSFIMTGVISLISTLRSAGFGVGFFPLWLGSWGLSWLVAFPTLMLVLPLVRRATAAIVQSDP
jgi:Protein of unknown function (DUF2798)